MELPPVQKPPRELYKACATSSVQYNATKPLYNKREQKPSMAIDDLVTDSDGKPLINGRVYAVRLDGYTFEGTYAGREAQHIILRTGKKTDGHGTNRQFDREELPLRVAQTAYPL